MECYCFESVLKKSKKESSNPTKYMQCYQNRSQKVFLTLLKFSSDLQSQAKLVTTSFSTLLKVSSDLQPQ